MNKKHAPVNALLPAYAYIRWSSDEQTKGDSERRQIEGARQYAAKHNLDLPAANIIKDSGLSAFTGENVTRGKLGKHLADVREGKIPAGTPFLVEALDRLSRQDISKSTDILRTFMSAGIDVHTIADGRIYKGKDFGIVDHMLSGMAAYLGNLESQQKRGRVAGAWKTKRLNAATKPLTSVCPGWLKISNDKKSFVPILDRVKVVRSIFEDAAAGIGIYSTMTRLNQKNIPTFGSGEGWQKGVIAKILTTKAVLGEFQPHIRLDGKRVPDGEPIKNYFPAVIDEDLYYRALEARLQRRTHSAGRKGNNIANLFSGLAHCAYCNGVMRYENKGSAKKNGGAYLVCERARRGLDCEKTAWRYDQFESSFLAWVVVVDLDLNNVLGDDKNFVLLEKELEAKRGKLAEHLQKQELTYELFAKGGEAADFISKKLNELATQIEQLETVIQQKENALAAAKAEASEFRRGKDQIKQLIEQVNGKDSYELRAKIAAQIKSLVSTLIVAPAGFKPNKKTDADNIADLIDQRYFCVGFKDGSGRGVCPSDKDPTSFTSLFGFSKDMRPEDISDTRLHRWLYEQVRPPSK